MDMLNELFFVPFSKFAPRHQEHLNEGMWIMVNGERCMNLKSRPKGMIKRQVLINTETEEKFIIYG